MSARNEKVAARCAIAGLLAFITLVASASTVTFKPVQTYSAGTNPTSVAVGDFDGDGKSDLAVFNSGSNNVTILLGKADETFQSVGSFPAGIPPDGPTPSFAVGDFNGDGKPDVVILFSAEVHILLGNGDGTLQAPIATILDFGQGVAGVADVNGDKKADLIVYLSDSGNAWTGVAVLLGNGDGTFQASKTVMSGQWGLLTVADLSADGKPDLVIGNSGTVQIMLGRGDGTFSQGIQAVLKDGYTASAASAEDVNGDGRVDLIVSSSLATQTRCGGPIITFPCTIITQRASVLLGGNGGALQAEQVVVSGSSIGSIAGAGDFNGDGKLDIAVTVGDSSAFYPGNGDGTFGSLTALDVPGAISLAVDLNGDQLADLVVLDAPNKSIDVLLNATPTFSMITSTNTLTAGAGQQVTDTLSFTGVNGFSSTLQLSCQVVGPAPAPTCSLSPASITAGASSSTSTLAISVPTASASLLSPQNRLPLQPLYALALPFAFLGFGFRQRRAATGIRRWLLGTSLATAALLCTACGGGNSNSQSVHRSASYTVQVTATSDTLTKTAQISVTVP